MFIRLFLTIDCVMRMFIFLKIHSFVLKNDLKYHEIIVKYYILHNFYFVTSVDSVIG